MSTLLIGGTTLVGLAGLWGGRAYFKRRALGRRQQETAREVASRLETRRREAAAQEAALQDAAQAVARLETTLSARETRLARGEEDLGARQQSLVERERALEREAQAQREHVRELARREADVERAWREAREGAEAARARLAEVAGLDPAAARRQWLEALEAELEGEKVRRIHAAVEGARAEAERRAREVVLTAIQRLAVDQCAQSTVSRVPIPSDDLKGRIIGREGRNVRALEAATGCDLIVDDTPGAVLVSSFDGVRREVACRALSRLLDEGRLQPGRIEEVVAEERQRVDAALADAGRAAFLEAGLGDPAPQLAELLGRLRYRTSYGQNVLAHSLEVAHLTGLMASELGLDATLARRAGLLHDVGKALDHRLEGRHDTIAGRVLRGLGESEQVIEIVASHHEAGDRMDAYAALVQVADAISASRPGARRESVERYVERLSELERIASSFPGVASAYAVHAGREVRVLVDANVLDDAGAARLARDVARRIESDLAWSGEIRVTVIREVRTVETAR